MRTQLSIVTLLVLISSVFTSAAEDWLTFPGGEGPGKGKHIALLAGDEEYRSEEAMPQLAKILSQHHGFKCTVHFSVNDEGIIDPTNQKSVTGSELFEHADAMVLSLRFRQYPDEERARFNAAIHRGIPIVGLRTSTHAFRGPMGKFGKEVLGENWVSHWGHHKSEATRGVVEPGQAENEILRGVKEIFGTSDVYEAYPPEDAKILMRGLVLKGMEPGDEPSDREKKRSRGDKAVQGINDPAMPIVWTREHKYEAGNTSRIVCTTMGAATDLENEGLRRLIVNSVYWGLEMEVPESANVEIVGEFKPTMYGFNTFRTGLRPADFLKDALPEPELETAK